MNSKSNQTETRGEANLQIRTNSKKEISSHRNFDSKPKMGGFPKC